MRWTDVVLFQFGSLQDPGSYLSLSGLDSGTGADGGDMMDPSLWEVSKRLLAFLLRQQAYVDCTR